MIYDTSPIKKVSIRDVEGDIAAVRQTLKKEHGVTA
jgi:hypothetical protein